MPRRAVGCPSELSETKTRSGPHSAAGCGPNRQCRAALDPRGRTVPGASAATTGVAAYRFGKKTSSLSAGKLGHGRLDVCRAYLAISCAGTTRATGRQGVRDLNRDLQLQRHDPDRCAEPARAAGGGERGGSSETQFRGLIEQSDTYPGVYSPPRRRLLCTVGRERSAESGHALKLTGIALSKGVRREVHHVVAYHPNGLKALEEH